MATRRPKPLNNGAAPASHSPQATVHVDALQSPPSPPPTFCAFAPSTLLRSQITRYAKNPRTIDKHAQKKLRENIRRNGLVEPLVVNRRGEGTDSSPYSYTLVGGHQRMAAMDQLRDYEKTSEDYAIPVAVLEVDDAREAQLVVSLNNQSIQGAWDQDLLAELLTNTPGIDPLATGFDRAELSFLLDSGVVDHVFGDELRQQAESESPQIAIMEAIKDAGNEARKSGEQRDDASPTHLTPPASPASQAGGKNSDGGDCPGVDPVIDGSTPIAPSLAVAATADSSDSSDRLDPNSVEAMKRRRAEYIATARNDNSVEFMLIVVFDNDQQLHEFCEAAQLPAGDKYVSGCVLADRMGIELG